MKAEKEVKICELCNNEIVGGVVVLDNTTMCNDCFRDNTFVCEDCGVITWDEDRHGGASNRILCGSCYDRYYQCTECNALVTENNVFYEDEGCDDPLCYDCYSNKTKGKSILSYNHKPEPTFFGSGNLFMGVELEIDEGGELDEKAEKLLNIANTMDDRIYIMSRGK